MSFQSVPFRFDPYSSSNNNNRLNKHIVKTRNFIRLLCKKRSCSGGASVNLFKKNKNFPTHDRQKKKMKIFSLFVLHARSVEKLAFPTSDVPTDRSSVAI